MKRFFLDILRACRRTAEVIRHNFETTSNPLQVTVWYDYSCPHCHIGLVRLEALEAGASLLMDRRPYLLRPGLDSTAPPLQGPNAGSGRLMEPGWKLRQSSAPEPFSNRSLNTLLAHEATAYAKEQGLDREFYAATARQYWESGADLGSLYTLRTSALKCGLDWDVLCQRLESRHYREAVLQEHQAAIDRGVNGVPAYLIGDELFHGNGAVGELLASVRASR